MDQSRRKGGRYSRKDNVLSDGRVRNWVMKCSGFLRKHRNRDPLDSGP